MSTIRCRMFGHNWDRSHHPECISKNDKSCLSSLFVTCFKREERHVLSEVRMTSQGEDEMHVYKIRRVLVDLPNILGPCKRCGEEAKDGE